MTTLQQAHKMAADELARRERNISHFFAILTEADLEMLAAADDTKPRYQFVTKLCEDVEKRGGDLDAALIEYRKGE